MRDIFEMLHEADKETLGEEEARKLFAGKVQEELKNMDISEFASHLKCIVDKFNCEYRIILTFPMVSSNVFPIQEKMKNSDKWNIEDMDVLNEKDLMCIARILQGAIYADSLFYHCGCCQYKTECFPKTEELHIKYHFLKVREKLQEITGIELSVFNNKSAESIRKKIQSENKNVSEKGVEVDSIDKTIEMICNRVQRIMERGQAERSAELIKGLAVLITARNSQAKVNIDELGEKLVEKIDAAMPNVR